MINHNSPAFLGLADVRFGSKTASHAYSSSAAAFGVKRTLATDQLSGCFRSKADSQNSETNLIHCRFLQLLRTSILGMTVAISLATLESSI